jgi:tripartite-type tricarboxylate transporter receptor subunit TctC
MTLKSRWACLALAALLGALSANAFSQSAYPSKPLKIVVPFGAGGVADLTARTVAQKLGENLGQSIVIENKPGAGGVVATDAVAKSAPDGYTLLLMSNATAVSAGLFKILPYDAEKDLTPCRYSVLLTLPLWCPKNLNSRRCKTCSNLPKPTLES